jgi:hypothetical protein
MLFQGAIAPLAECSKSSRSFFKASLNRRNNAEWRLLHVSSVKRILRSAVEYGFQNGASQITPELSDFPRRTVPGGIVSVLCKFPRRDGR